jgi:hypothetical protein
MSKAVKSVGRAVSKTFKKVTDTVKKVAKSKVGKALVGAAAIYFTGGLAAGSFAPSAVGSQIMSWASSGANAVSNFASSIFGGGGAATTVGAAAPGATTTSLATALGSSAPTMSTALGSAAGTSAATAASMAAPAATTAAASPSIFSQAVTGFAKLPATTQLMLGNAAMQGFGAVAQQRQTDQMIEEQRRREEAAKGNFTPVKLEPFRPQSIYSRVG